MKRLARHTAIVLATLVVLLLLWELRLVILVFALSLLMAAFVRPLVTQLTRFGIPLAVAMLAIYLAGLILFGLAFFLISGPLGQELQTLVDALAFRYEGIHPAWVEGSAFQQQVARLLPPAENVYELLAAREGQFLAETLFGVGNTMTAILGGAASVLVLSIYWTIDKEHFERLWLSLLDPERRRRARAIWRATEIGVGSYLRSEVVQAVFAVILLGIVYYLIGIHYPILLALISGLLWLVPLVGFLLTIIPAFLAGYATSLLVAILAVLFTAAVLLGLELFIEPRVFNQRRHYNPLLTVLLIIPLADAFGLLGFLAAPPLAVTIQSFLTSLSSPGRVQIHSVYPAAQIEGLLEQLQEVQTSTLQLENTPPPEVDSLVQRLTELLVEAKTAFSEQPPPLHAADDRSAQQS